jgi:hypothetical protein
MIVFIAPYTFTQFRTTGNYSAIAMLHTFQFTVAQALGFSVLTSHILAMGLSQSHCHFKSHMKSSWHNLIPFLPFLLYHLLPPSPELDPVLFRLLFCTPCSSASTVVYSSLSHSQSQSYVKTDGQSASLSWNKAPIWGLCPDFHYCHTVAGLLIWGALSDERIGLSFTMYNIQYIYILHAVT